MTKLRIVIVDIDSETTMDIASSLLLQCTSFADPFTTQALRHKSTDNNHINAKRSECKTGSATKRVLPVVAFG